MSREVPESGAGRATPGLPGVARPAPARSRSARRYGVAERPALLEGLRAERSEHGRVLRAARGQHGQAVPVASCGEVRTYRVRETSGDAEIRA